MHQPLITCVLQTTSLSDPSTHNLLFATLTLLNRVINLTSTNKALAAEWVDCDEHARLLVNQLATLSVDQKDHSPSLTVLVHHVCSLLGALKDRMPDVPDASIVSRKSAFGTTQGLTHSFVRLAVPAPASR